MTGMSEIAWKAAADAGAHVTLAVPIEMQMRHGTPPIQKALDLKMSLSLSTDVECTMTADMFTQMRGVLTLQRMFANELALQGKDYPKLHVGLGRAEPRDDRRRQGPQDRLQDRFADPGQGRRHRPPRRDRAQRRAAQSRAGAVVTLMERSNVSTVLCAGQIKKWRGAIIGYDIPKLRAELDASRDYVFAAAGIERDLFRA